MDIEYENKDLEEQDLDQVLGKERKDNSTEIEKEQKERQIRKLSCREKDIGKKLKTILLGKSNVQEEKYRIKVWKIL